MFRGFFLLPKPLSHVSRVWKRVIKVWKPVSKGSALPPRGWKRVPNHSAAVPNGWKLSSNAWNLVPNGWNLLPNGWNFSSKIWNLMPKGRAAVSKLWKTKSRTFSLKVFTFFCASVHFSQPKREQFCRASGFRLRHLSNQ